MSIRARLKRLEVMAPSRGIAWENFHARWPEEIVPDDSGIDWALLFVPCEITDPLDAPLRELAEAPRPLIRQRSSAVDNEFVGN